jgi:hypothetical protein
VVRVIISAQVAMVAPAVVVLAMLARLAELLLQDKETMVDQQLQRITHQAAVAAQGQ